VLAPLTACGLALLFTLGLLGLGLLSGVRRNPLLFYSFVGAAAALAAWTSGLFVSATRQRRRLTLHIAPRKQHYLQALAQGAVLAYWGWYWPPVYESAHLIAAQLVFAYAVELLLTWSRRDTHVLGFGPFPVVFSINLFLWFKEDWFYLQFLMVAVGFAAKELIRWERDGRLVHIFNPSAFTLALFSLALLLRGASDITWGTTIAVTQFYPPHIYWMLFLIGLPGQILFGVASMTMAAAVTTYVFGLLYFAATGVYFFYDSYIPIAVFLGMLLLFTDPSTSPRTELGRLMFGALYGLSTIVLYDLLWRTGMPTFYDKLLQVPLLNLSVKWLDRAARSRAPQSFDPGAVARSLVPRRRYAAWVMVWAIVFSGMSAVQGVGDAHPGQWLPFWQQACRDGRRGACEFLAAREASHCEGGSGWACNEAGIQRLRLGPSSGTSVDPTSRVETLASFQRGCQLGFDPACRNLRALLTGAGPPASAPPTVNDYPIVLRGTKEPVKDVAPPALYALACKQGWEGTCAGK
jgi:hypothetical protein